MRLSVKLFIAAGAMVLLAANAVIYSPLVQKLGPAGTASAVAEAISFGSSAEWFDNEEELTLYLCNEIERAEATVWPQVALWATNVNHGLPELADVRSAKRVLERAQLLAAETPAGQLIASRLDVLSPFAEAGFGPAGEDVADAFERVRELNEEMEGLCPSMKDQLSYKGFVVDRGGVLPGLTIGSNYKDFGGEGTPACWVQVTDAARDSEAVLSLQTSVSSATSTSRETHELSLATIAAGRERSTELGWLGLVEEGAGFDRQSFIVFDFEAPANFESPTVFTCEATFDPGIGSASERSEVYVWELGTNG